MWLECSGEESGLSVIQESGFEQISVRDRSILSSSEAAVFWEPVKSLLSLVCMKLDNL